GHGDHAQALTTAHERREHLRRGRAARELVLAAADATVVAAPAREQREGARVGNRTRVLETSRESRERLATSHLDDERRRELLAAPAERQVKNQRAGEHGERRARDDEEDDAASHRSRLTISVAGWGGHRGPRARRSALSGAQGLTSETPTDSKDGTLEGRSHRCSRAHHCRQHVVCFACCWPRSCSDCCSAFPSPRTQ